MFIAIMFVIFFGSMYLINKIYKTGDKNKNDINQSLLNDVENIV